MKYLIQIDPIAVKDKNDVIKALTILEKIGIEILSEEKKKTYLIDTTKDVKNNFMIQEDDGGFRIQSHYIGFGISLENLEKQLDEILEKHPNICEKIKEIIDKKKELIKEMEEMNQKFTEEFKSLNQSIPIIILKEK